MKHFKGVRIVGPLIDGRRTIPYNQTTLTTSVSPVFGLAVYGSRDRVALGVWTFKKALSVWLDSRRVITMWWTCSLPTMSALRLLIVSHLRPCPELIHLPRLGALKQVRRQSFKRKIVLLESNGNFMQTTIEWMYRRTWSSRKPWFCVNTIELMRIWLIWIRTSAMGVSIRRLNRRILIGQYLNRITSSTANFFQPFFTDRRCRSSSCCPFKKVSSVRRKCEYFHFERILGSGFILLFCCVRWPCPS